MTEILIDIDRIKTTHYTLFDNILIILMLIIMLWSFLIAFSVFYHISAFSNDTMLTYFYIYDFLLAIVMSILSIKHKYSIINHIVLFIFCITLQAYAIVLVEVYKSKANNRLYKKILSLESYKPLSNNEDYFINNLVCSICKKELLHKK